MRTRGLVSLLMVFLSGCGTALVKPTDPSASATPGSTPQTPSQSASPMLSAAPTPSPTPAAPESTPIASGTTVDRCVNESGIYAVTYPADWYSNGGGLSWDSWDDCSLFGPQQFTDAYDPAIAIVLLAQPLVPWSDPFSPLTGDFEGYRVLRDEATTIGGRDAWVREFELTTSVSGSHDAGDRQLTYSVVIGGDWYLSADAVVPVAEYDETRAVLDAMLESLEVLAIPGS